MLQRAAVALVVVVLVAVPGAAANVIFGTAPELDRYYTYDLPSWDDA